MKTNRKLFPVVACLVFAMLLAVVPMLGIGASADTSFKFVVPEGIETPTGTTNSLPTANAPTGYTFVGWTENKVDETTNKPTYFEAGDTYTGDAHKLYALYSRSESGGTTTVYTLVENVSDLAVGNKIIIAASGYNYAIGPTSSNANNRTQAAITKTDNTITFGSDVQIITLKEGNKSGTFAFDVGTGYLCAASSSSNNLKTKSTLDDNGSWLISISEGKATIKAQGTYTRNLIRYNSSSSLFSCYASGQKDVSIYKGVESASDSTTYYTTGNVDETFTLTFNTAEGLSSVGNMTAKESASTITLPTPAGNADYTFEGWITSDFDGDTLAAPEMYSGEYTVTDDTTFYAVYSFTRTVNEGIYVLVTDASSLTAGDKVIIAAADFNTALSTNQTANNRAQSVIFKDGDYVYADGTTEIITLEAGAASGTFAFNVAGGYLYAASSGNNHLKTQSAKDDNASWAITVTDRVASIVAQGSNTKNILQYNKTSSLFSCYATSSQNGVSIYKATEGVSLDIKLYTTSACTHTTTTETINAAPTCFSAGSKTVSCANCGAVLATEELPILEHNVENGVCTLCGMREDYTGIYYIAAMRPDATEYVYATTIFNKSDKRFGLVDSNLTILPSFISSASAAFAFEFEKNGDGTYYLSIPAYLDDAKYLKVTDDTIVTFATKDEATPLNVTFTDGKCTISDPKTQRSFGFNNTTDRCGWYKQSATTAVSVIPVEGELARVKVNAASITIGTTLAMKYYITLPEGYSIEDVKAEFTMNSDSATVTTYGTNGGEYVFTYDNIPPQCMGDNIRAEFTLVGKTVALKDEYSILKNAENLSADANADLKALLADLLNYGAAAQEYKNYKTNNLVNRNFTGATSTLPTEDDDNRQADFPLDEANQFTAVGVRFDYANKIYAKFKVASSEGVTVKINGVEAEFEKSGTQYIVYTDYISALEYDEVFTFELLVDGVVVHTVTYSVNSYAYAMAEDQTMSGLALALYRYGKSAEKYRG